MKKSYSSGDIRRDTSSKEYSFKIKLTQKQLSKVEKNFSALVRDFTNLTVQLNSLSRIDRELINSLDDFCRDETSGIKESVYDISDSLSKVEVLDGMLSNTLQSRVVLPLSKYSHICKQQREHIEQLSNLQRKYSKAIKIVLKEENKNQKSKPADDNVKQEVLEVMNELKALDTQLHNFERQKMKDFKEILSQYIHGNLVYHAKALEAFTAAYNSLGNINIDEHVEEVLTKRQENKQRLKIVRTNSLSSLFSSDKE